MKLSYTEGLTQILEVAGGVKPRKNRFTHDAHAVQIISTVLASKRQSRLLDPSPLNHSPSNNPFCILECPNLADHCSDGEFIHTWLR